MYKYSTSFKLSVVEAFLEGSLGSKRIGQRFGIDHSTVREWVAGYEAHGAASLSKKFRHYDAAFKLSVLQRMWEDGLSCRQTAALFNLRRRCLADWERRYKTDGIDALNRAAKEAPDQYPSRQCRQKSGVLFHVAMIKRAAKNCWRN